MTIASAFRNSRALFAKAGDASMRARSTLEDMGESHSSAQQLLHTKEWQPILTTVFECSPFLTDAVIRHPEVAAYTLTHGPDYVLNTLYGNAEPSLHYTTVESQLRLLRHKAALAIALADIAGAWNVETVTNALSTLADWCLARAFAVVWQEAVDTGKLHASPPQESGLFIIAMGKLGAEELNYSSDIDIILYYDPLRIRYHGDELPRRTLVRLTQRLISLLQERTGDGYVFRVDVRLRPDPFSTPIIMSTHAAHSYYESVGQNWERAAYIKARIAAGDHDAGTQFLHELRPFIWRKYLDFAAIADIESIKRQIDAAHGGVQGDALFEHNIKLGAGGIREIELFAQTQQLIRGGKMPALRASSTCTALAALADAGIIAYKTVEELTTAYMFLRQVEHALQMQHDQQTHSLPSTEQEMHIIALMLGYKTTEMFLDALSEQLALVQKHSASLFSDAPLSAPSAKNDTSHTRHNLVFTGTEDDPDTLKTLTSFGFNDAKRTSHIIRQWHSGSARATRSSRARELLTEIVPALLSACAKTPTPDDALLGMDRFFCALPSGVQWLSIMQSEPHVLPLLTTILSSGERLAAWLCEYPYIAERLITQPPTAAADLAYYTGTALMQELQQSLALTRHEEDKLLLCRQFTNEHNFLIAVQLLIGTLSPFDAGHCYSAIADVSVSTIVSIVEQEFAKQHGVPEAGQFALLAAGKWAEQQLTFNSDLDIIFIYQSAGRGTASLPVDSYYSRLAQRVIQALSRQMQYGNLYDIDTRLRPYGKDGPVASSVNAFDAYYQNHAWTYEKLALVHARVISNHAEFAHGLTQHLVSLRNDDSVSAAQIEQDAKDLLHKIRHSLTTTDPWHIKHAKGGLLECQIAEQLITLIYGTTIPEDIQPTHHALKQQCKTYIALQQLLRLSHTDSGKIRIPTQHLYKLLKPLLPSGDTKSAKKTAEDRVQMLYNYGEELCTGIIA